MEPSAIRRSLPRTVRSRLPRDVNTIRVSAATARRLNRVYRGKGATPNVLSFRYGDDYGEIVLCLPIIRREAKRQGNSVRFQLTWMILHGMLHLAGMHHERSLRASRSVEALERRILRNLFPL